MSSETLPISPARFAEAIRGLPAASLLLKTLEIRNSLAHLAHSNAQLRPFAEGLQTSHGGAPGQPDPDCADAIRENEAVMGRMRARVALVRAEVERRGLSWREFEDRGDGGDDGEEAGDGAAAAAPLANGVDGHASSAGDTTSAAASSSGSNPWTDGTFQTGVIRNGEVVMDSVPARPSGEGAATTSTTEGAAATSSAQPVVGRNLLSDAELERLLALRMAEDGDDEDGGLHL